MIAVRSWALVAVLATYVLGQLPSRLAVGRIWKQMEDCEQRLSVPAETDHEWTVHSRLYRGGVTVLCTRSGRRGETGVRFFGAPTGRSHPPRNLRGRIQFWSRLARDC